MPALEELIVGWLDRCCAMGLDFAAEVARLEKPHCELKWEIPIYNRRSIERRQEMSGQKDKPMPDIAFKFMAWMLGVMRDRFQNPRAKLERVGIRKGQTVLDFGCGIGSFAIPATQIVGERGKVYALDIHPLAIEAVEKKAKKEKLTNITAILSDRDTGLPDESIDVILLYDTIHMIKAKQALLEELHRVLKPDGFLSVWAPHQPKVNKTVEIVQENGLFSLRDQDKKLLSFKKRISSKP